MLWITAAAAATTTTTNTAIFYHFRISVMFVISEDIGEPVNEIRIDGKNSYATDSRKMCHTTNFVTLRLWGPPSLSNGYQGVFSCG